MHQGLLLVTRRSHAFLRGRSVLSGGGAFGLLDRSMLKELLEFALDPSSLGSGRRRHGPEQYRGGGHILTRSVERRGLFSPVVVLDATKDASRISTGAFVMITARPFTLEGALEEAELLLLLAKPGLELMDLCELHVLVPCGGHGQAPLP